MRLAQHLDLPVQILELLEPTALGAVASPEVGMPTQLVATLLQRAQLG